MKKLALMFGIVMCLSGNINAKALNSDEIKKALDECIDGVVKEQIEICQKHIDNGLPSIDNCNKDTCESIGAIFGFAEHFNQAEQYYLRAIALGGKAYYSLGNLYEKTNKISQAKKYYKIGCDMADYSSCDKLGTLYASNKEYPIAKKYWDIACDNGQSFACNKLFIMYFRGDGVRQNLALSKEYCAKFIGNEERCDSVEKLIDGVVANTLLNAAGGSFAYRIDNSVNEEFRRLLNNVNNGDEELRQFNASILLKAIENGEVPSINECDKDTCYELAGFYAYDGRNGNNKDAVAILEKIQDIDKAILYMKKAVDLGNISGYAGLGDFYIDNDINTAKYYYDLGCKKGDYSSCHNIGYVYKNKKDYQSAKKHFELSCNKNNKVVASRTRSCMNLGDMYEKGLGVLHSYPKAIEYYKIACESKEAFGCVRLAAIYLRGGVGVAQNFSIAKQYSGKACNLGLQEACEVYKNLNESGVK